MHRLLGRLCSWGLQFVYAVKVYTVSRHSDFLPGRRLRFVCRNDRCACDCDAVCDEESTNLLLMVVSHCDFACDSRSRQRLRLRCCGALRSAHYLDTIRTFLVHSSGMLLQEMCRVGALRNFRALSS